MRNLVQSILLLLALTSCNIEQVLGDKAPSIGENYKNYIRIGTADMQIPLPEGSWKLVGMHNYENDVGTTFTIGLLADIQENILKRSIVFEVPLGTTNSGYEKNARCERDEYHFVRNRFNVEGSIQDCWYINHNIFRMNGRYEEIDLKPDYMKQARRYFITNEIKTPLETIYVKYHKASSTKLMNIWYHFSPELDGFTSNANATWQNSNWHRDKVRLNQERASYIQNLKNWGIRFEQNVTASFAGKFGTEEKTPDIVSLAKDLKDKKRSPEARMELARLTEMHMEGLINDKEYGELILYVIWKY